MKKLSKKTIAFLAAAVILFAGSGAIGTRAVLNIYSPDYTLQFGTDDQDVALLENGTVVSGDNTMLAALSGKVAPGKVYQEEIQARNTSNSDQFVRIVVRKYWVNADTRDRAFADRELDPAEINLVFAGGNWVENASERTTERQVFYYKNLVPSGETTDNLTTTISVSGDIANLVTYSEPDENGVITYTYEYDGRRIVLEAAAQSIQTHNASEAVKSIWGVQNVTATETALSVN